MKYFWFLLFYLTILSSYGQSNNYIGRLPIVGSYPEESPENITLTWKEMKVYFEEALAFKELQDLDHNINLTLEIWYSFGRIEDIDWSEQDRKEIVLYLEYFLNEVERKMKGNIASTGNSVKVASFPYLCLWTILKLDFEKGYELLQQQIGLIDNAALIRLLEDYYEEKDLNIELTPINRTV
ncbi:MAG: hypothetical protein AAF849_23440 [Bacteroidota bacterium]